MTKGDWEFVGTGPAKDAGAVWRLPMSNGGWLYAMWNVQAKSWSLAFVPL